MLDHRGRESRDSRTRQSFAHHPTAKAPRLGRTLAALLLVFAAGFIASAAHPAAADQSVTTATVISADGLNLRSDPAASSAILTVIPGSTQITLTGPATPDNWYPVQYAGFSGFVNGQFLSMVAATQPADTSPAAGSGTPAATASATASSAAPASSATAAATVTTPDGLNLRSGPGSSNSVITILPVGATLIVTGAASGLWLPVTYNGASGWVDSTFIAIGTAGPAGTASASTAGTMTTSVITSNAATSSGGASVVSPGTSGAATPVPAGPAAVAPDRSDMGKVGPPESGLAVAHPPASDLIKFIWPVVSRRISTRFSGNHQAIDIDEFPSGHNPVRAIADGIVTYAGGDACCSYGLYVIIQHVNGFSSLYAHFSSLEVKLGQVVTQGQEIGRSGNTGNSTGAHLHFAIYYHHDPLDPLGVLPSGADFEPGV